MKLNEGIIGHTYRVEGVAVNETITRRLEALGVNSMTPVTLLNKKAHNRLLCSLYHNVQKLPYYLLIRLPLVPFPKHAQTFVF